MTENMAGRGEGLAGLVKKWREQPSHQDTMPLSKEARAVVFARGLCAKELETALEAAAPAGTAPLNTQKLMNNDRLEEIRAQLYGEDDGITIDDAKWLLHAYEQLINRVATPPPQAPQEQSTAFSPTEQTPSSMATAADMLGAFLAENGVEIKFGLAAQGHIPTVEKMLYEGKSWDEIGSAINWHGPTAKEYYKRHLQRAAAATQEPAGSEAANIRERLQVFGERLRKYSCPRTNISDEFINGWDKATDHCAERIESILRNYPEPGSPRKVGEDGAQTFEQWWESINKFATDSDRLDHTIWVLGRPFMARKEAAELAWHAALARPSSVPVGEPPEPMCICAQGVTKCPRHGEQPAQREPCPLCGAPLGYCAEGEYCTKKDCKYVA